MPSYLLFQLYGHLQSCGSICPGEVRHIEDHPSKSAVLGLLAGALGIRRDEPGRLAALARGYWFAVRQDAPGTPMADYHTVQTRSGKPGAFATRRMELCQDIIAGKSLGTTLSMRYYWQDAMFTACLCPVVQAAPYALEDLKRALEHPEFAPYLGRKSCPPGLPFMPLVVEAAGLSEAFQAYPPEKIAKHRKTIVPGLRRESAAPPRLFWENPQESVECRQYTLRRDDLADSIHWHYRVRVEFEGVACEPRKEES